MDNKFLILGNKNACTYKEVFPCIKNNQLWLGTTKPDIFNTPSGAHTEKLAGLTRWFTNLTSVYERKPLVLTKRYSPENYPKYDNYDAIEVSRVADIPVDYDGVMGVPITFLDKYCNSQFEIVGGYNYSRDYEGNTWNGKVNGKYVYKRLLIRHKPVEFEIVGIGCGNSWANYTETLEELGFDPSQKYGGGLGAPILDEKGKYARVFIKYRPESR